ncbi:MAG: transcription termination factor Rho, partial [Microthrixaceae bacterium]
MSVDSIDLDGLERKDRAELATIAQALGGKPGSRAKKADIISMILELAGVTPESPAPAAAEGGDEHASPIPSDPPTASDGPIPSEDPTAGDALVPSAATKGTGRRGASGRGADAPAPEPMADAPSGRNRGTADRSGNDQPGNEQTATDRSGNDQPGNDRSGNEASDNDQGQQSDQSGNEQGQQGDQQAEGEGGRRRRRRRGRDRDRNDEQGEGNQTWEGELIEVAGILDLRDEGYGFLRVSGLLPSRDDVYVSVKQTRQFGLRRGDWVTGASRPANRSEKNPALLRIDTVNGADPERSRERPAFEDLTPLFPQERLRLERDDHPYDIAGRVIDLLSPIGKGQRGLIVSPPKAGKTTIMKTIAQCIEANHPEVELMVLLVDERPEEVTDMRRSIEGEVVASTFDRPAEEHIQVAELAIERAKRMVEQGQDGVVILYGITRLARAYNR